MSSHAIDNAKGWLDTISEHIEALGAAEESGDGRAIDAARLKVKCELAFAGGDTGEGERLARVIDAYGAPPVGNGFAGLSMRGPFGTMPTSTAGRDLASQDPGLDPAPDPQTGPAEPEAVAADGQVADESAVATANIVKVLTLTGQAVFVARSEWENPVQRVLQRFKKDGTQLGERIVLRENIERQVLPRNRGDKPIRAPKGNASIPAADGVAERLERLERIVAGMSPAEAADRPKRTAAHMRALRAYLQLREARVQLRRTESCLRDERQLASALATKVDALERLHAASAVLDTKPANDQPPKPAIIMPVRTAGARG